MSDDALTREFAYTQWADSCQDIYNLQYRCRRQYGHDGDHAAGFGAARVTWPQDPPEGWFFDWPDEPKRGLLQRINAWMGRH